MTIRHYANDNSIIKSQKVRLSVRSILYSSNFGIDLYFYIFVYALNIFLILLNVEYDFEYDVILYLSIVFRFMDVAILVIIHKNFIKNNKENLQSTFFC